MRGRRRVPPQKMNWRVPTYIVEDLQLTRSWYGWTSMAEIDRIPLLHQEKFRTQREAAVAYLKALTNRRIRSKKQLISAYVKWLITKT